MPDWALLSERDNSNTGRSTLGFGGIDFTPRGYRVIEVDDSGARSWWETVEAPNPPLARVAGQAAVVDERVVVAHDRDVSLPEDQVAAPEIVDLHTLQLLAQCCFLQIAVARHGHAAGAERDLHEP